MLDFRNLQLNVSNVQLRANKRLCYLDKFGTINSLINVTKKGNKDTEICKREGRVCSKLCDSNKGCWGPFVHNCFQCRWKVERRCVEKCELQENYFTPSNGHVCSRCHSSCRYGCVGPKKSQCYLTRRQLNDLCPKYMFFDNAAKRCKECPKKCIGNNFEKRHRLTVRACTGPKSSAGPRGCSVECQGATFLSISSDGRLLCSPCHENCQLCRNGSFLGCLQIRQTEKPTKESQIYPSFTPSKKKSDNNFFLIAGLMILGALILLLIIIMTFFVIVRRCSFTGLVKSKTQEIPENGVELLILYWSSEFSPISKPEVQHQVQCFKSPSYIKCRMPLLSVGLTPFHTIQDAISPFFVEDIREIGQRRGLAAGIVVAEVTTSNDEFKSNHEEKLFCTVEGDQYSWEEAGKPECQMIGAGDSVIMCDRRRTVILIDS